MSILLKKINQVREFHTVFGLPASDQPTVAVNEKLVALRHRLMEEENNEYLEACQQGDLSLVADALGDKLYILFGTIITHGLQHKIEEVFDEIHRSNMSKLDEHGKPVVREDGKILKSNLYFKPDIAGVLNK